MQRELEQNAKNCRILQFKLRKSERQRDQLQTEKNHIGNKLRELQNGDSSISETHTIIRCPTNSQNTNEAQTQAAVAVKEMRIKELESELRIAKEVSVRLHMELEAAEDKR